MATNQQWQDYIKALEQYIKDLRAWLRTQKDGEISTADAGLETPPKPPPNP